MNITRMGVWLMAGASAFALTAGARAQSAGQPQNGETAAPGQALPGTAIAQPNGAASPQAQDVAGPGSGDIVVTGSRTIRNGDASPSPVTVIATQDILQAQPGTLSNALQLLPVFAGSRTTSANPTFNGSATGGNSASNQLNLRNLGANRTLVLLDGYRVPPTSFNNIVDVDIIPELLVQRVDTVTGGVSAVYGSDAVAGVVNYVIDKKFTGIRFDAEKGISQRGDNPRYQLGLALGTSLFGGRGHLEGSFQIIDEAGIDTRSSRPWIHNVGVAGSGTAANPYVLLTGLRQANYAFGGKITNGVLANRFFSADGVLSPFTNGGFAGVAGTAGTTALQVGGDGAYYDSQLVSSFRAKQFFARYDHELFDGVRAYAQVSGDIKTNGAYADPVQFQNFTFRADNPFLPPAVRSQLAAGSTFTMSEIMGNFSRLNNRADSNQFTFSDGLDGHLGGVDFGINYTHGLSKLHTTMSDNVNNQRLAAALDATTNAAGQTVCYAATQAATAAAYANCQPLNVFGPTAANSSALFDYVLQPTDYRATTTQDDVSGHIAGSPFALPAGPVQVALSAEWRRLAFHGETTSPSSATADCTGLRSNCTATGATPTLLWAFGFANSPTISQTVKEVAAEVDVPILRDAGIAKSLSVNGAARYTSYNTSGNYWTWKIGGVWEVTDTLRFRATRSRDIRAPTLYELFAPRNSVPINPLDTLTNTSPRVPSTDLSNPALTAEIGNTVTAGFSWRPIRQLSITFDAYRIKIDNAVSQASGSNAAFQKLCYDSGGTSFWCTLQSRPVNYTSTAATNAVTGWFVKYLNIANIETKGADAEVNFTSRLFDRPMSLRLLTAYQPHAYYRVPGVPTIDQGNVAFGPTGYSAGAAWRVTGLARFQPIANVTVDLLEKWRSAMKIGGDESLVIVDNRISPFATTNFTLTFSFPQTWFGSAQLSGNVTNLFDAKPPPGAYTGNGTRAGLRDGFVPGDDVVGRYFSVSLKLRH